MQPVSVDSTLKEFENLEVEVLIRDQSSVVGTLRLFNSHQDIILESASKIVDGRVHPCGMIALRGDTIVSITLIPVEI